MLTYLSPRTHMPHSSSPLNPQRSSSPPLSSPTRMTGSSSSLPRFSLPSIKSSPTTPTARANLFSSPRSSPSRALSTRYTRTTPSSSIAARRPQASPGLSSPTADPFGEGNGATPTQNAMWRDRLQRRMADRERRKAARQNDLARRRGTMDIEDDDEAERRAQADDEELFRRLMVLQRRREQHALSGYNSESVEFWQDEADAVAREEIAICAALNQMETDPAHLAPSHDEDRWAHEAAEAEAAEHAQHAYGVETAHGYDDFHWEELDHEEPEEHDMHLGPEDWAAIQAMEDAMDEAMDVE